MSYYIKLSYKIFIPSGVSSSRYYHTSIYIIAQNKYKNLMIICYTFIYHLHIYRRKYLIIYSRLMSIEILKKKSLQSLSYDHHLSDKDIFKRYLDKINTVVFLYDNNEYGWYARIYWEMSMFKKSSMMEV